MKALIVSGGMAPSKEILLKELKTSEIVICADSGANHLFKYNIIPNVLIGDFDSISAEVLETFRNEGCIIETFPPEKDFTDTEIAIDYAIRKGYTIITLLGATGSRLDHVYGNIALLKKYAEKDYKIKILDDNNEIMYSRENLILYGESGNLFSLYAYGSQVEGLNVKGAKYELENYTLPIESSLGTSNEFIENEVKVTFKKGGLLIMQSRD